MDFFLGKFVEYTIGFFLDSFINFPVENVENVFQDLFGIFVYDPYTRSMFETVNKNTSLDHLLSVIFFFNDSEDIYRASPWRGAKTFYLHHD